MKIAEITDEHILFDNGFEITYDHDKECCEENYPDFEQLDDIGRETEFSENLIFETVDESGFRFGNEGSMFFIPCYSNQCGAYRDDVQIL